ncbi:tRNA (guanosine(46)-N7)-methyltransferase TrmB [Dongia deserti]|uniref:tRNA (guanosine(46)-N7)-methyltransferase TrmB n=1 Tax=Dongia deserti TaxID=2268030 RepID=UPI000E64D38E|nr:tRNA (guanosine(46)-N7)-methyltransferase TrmB [Dongia deserti]
MPEARDSENRRFYGRRKGRPLRKGQQHLIETLLPRLAVDLPGSGKLDPRALFPHKPDQVWLEIGFGGGEHLAEQARAHPEAGLIGCEVFLNGIATLLSQVSSLGLSNVRVYPEDARDLLDALPDASLDRVFLLFPDPWPKRRHADRRFIQPANLDQLARLMKPGAEFRVASDDPIYIGWVLAHLIRHPAFRWTARTPGDWRARPADWPGTRYESKALREGRRPVFLRFTRR